jgi:hypothetical protein
VRVHEVFPAIEVEIPLSNGKLKKISKCAARDVQPYMEVNDSIRDCIDKPLILDLEDANQFKSS